jgi:hypothetical protein
MKSTFKEYIKHHVPNFRPVTPKAEYYYFCGVSCYECESSTCYKTGKEPVVHKNQLKKIKEEHPEYFI